MDVDAEHFAVQLRPEQLEIVTVKKKEKKSAQLFQCHSHNLGKIIWC